MAEQPSPLPRSPAVHSPPVLDRNAARSPSSSLSLAGRSRWKPILVLGRVGAGAFRRSSAWFSVDRLEFSCSVPLELPGRGLLLDGPAAAPGTRFDMRGAAVKVNAPEGGADGRDEEAGLAGDVFAEDAAVGWA